MTTQEALDGIRARHGDAYADECEAILRRMQAHDEALKSIVAGHFGSVEKARAVADRMLSVVRLRAHGVTR